jgi:succinate dehydrogenase / fumarate reductase membrane anchor subunit
MAQMTHSRSTAPRDKGLGHWRWQRISALATLGLMVYFAYMVARIGPMDYAVAAAFVAVPVHALGLVVLLVAGLFHAALGVQMIIEDYVTLAQGRQRFVRLSQGVFMLLAVAGLAALTVITGVI